MRELNGGSRRWRRGASVLAISAMVFVSSTVASAAHSAPLPGGTQDPTLIPKYPQSLAIPPLMPSVAANTYRIAARPLVQQVLPAGFPSTKVWAYGSTNNAASFSWPAATIDTQHGTPTIVTWRNELLDAGGKFLPHMLPVDPTLHWATPPGPVDTRPAFTATPGPYTGPVPLVVHLHGAHVDPESDGYPRGMVPAQREQHHELRRLEHRGVLLHHRFELRERPGLHRGSRTGRLQLPQRSARHDALVPRPRARNDTHQRVHRPRWFLPHPRRVRAEPESSGALREVRDPDSHAGPVVRQGWLALLSGLAR